NTPHYYNTQHEIYFWTSHRPHSYFSCCRCPRCKPCEFILGSFGLSQNCCVIRIHIQVARAPVPVVSWTCDGDTYKCTAKLVRSRPSPKLVHYSDKVLQSAIW